MTAAALDSAPARLSPEAAETLAASLVGEMIQRWREGERLLAEDFLTRHPELWAHPAAAAELIYEELCLRQEYGPEMPVDQVLARFPQWRPQLAVLLDCQRLLGPRRAAPQFPAAGECLGDFLLTAELGRGAHGRVFVARQLSLGDRLVVLKLTPWAGREDLSLARLQHTNIVPLYSVQDHPARGLRALCMPYFGGATLAQLLAALRAQASQRRTGKDLSDALDHVPAASLPVVPTEGSARKALASASYVDAVCSIGAALADALHYAHERGLVHLDLKPSNVLLAADGQPMVLDFHLAQEPIHPDGPAPPWLGGTAGYMSPEQKAALLATQEGRPAPMAVDGRSDIYSLGVLLYEFLGGHKPVVGWELTSTTTLKMGEISSSSPTTVPSAILRPLTEANPAVSRGLADIVGKCLAHDAADRYPDMAALAADLRRHLAQLPLAGVRNRSLMERWHKWRRRRPHGVALEAMMLTVIISAGAVLLGAASHVTQRIEQARTALNDAQLQMAQGEFEGAGNTLQRGLVAVSGIPWQHDLVTELERQRSRAAQQRIIADRRAAVGELHELVERIRFLLGANQLAPDKLNSLEAPCRALWEKRAWIVQRLIPEDCGFSGPQSTRPRDQSLHGADVRDDLLDLAIFWADLQVRLASPSTSANAKDKALLVLSQADDLFGPSAVLALERTSYQAPGPPQGDSARLAPTVRQPASDRETAWQHFALARFWLRNGNVKQAALEADRAVHLQPHDLWPNFYQGLCQYRLGQYADAATAFSVCIGAAPDAATCYYHRGLAHAALGQAAQARADFDQASRLDPTLRNFAPAFTSHLR